MYIMTTATLSSLLLLLLVLASENAAKPQNVNISQTGSVRITTVNGVITCDEMTCPSKSIGCSVSVATTKDLANIETVRKCYDKERVTTKEEKTTSANPYPGTIVSSYSDSSNTGVIQHFNYGIGDNGDVSESELSSQLASINTELQEWQQKFQQEMEAFNTNFHKQMLRNFRSSMPKSLRI